MIPVAIRSGPDDVSAMYCPAPGPAVLICPPFGDEALKTARVWRDLSVRLAGHGIATLRFDLPGTGNSAGEPTDPDRIEAWRAAVRDCAAWLAPRHQGRVVLFGHRFGALLALDAALSGAAAERLVLLDPPRSGAELGRYLRARARLERPDATSEPHDHIVSGGVPLSPATLASMATLARSAVGTRLPDALLVLNSPASPWPDRLRADGAAVETIDFEGHDAFVSRDAFRARPPRVVLDRVVEDLVRSIGPITSRALAPTPRPRGLRFDGLEEVPLWFGADRGLFGILCRPDFPGRGKRGLLLPTTGADPCSGMSRMWTDLARRLARQGVTSLRFDMRCVGESEGTPHGSLLASTYDPARVIDLRAAIEALGDHGCDDVNVVGYCSGAYAAWHAAVTDPRIAAILAANLLYLNLQPDLSEDTLFQRPGESQIGMPSGLVARLLPRRSIMAIRRLDGSTRRFVPKHIRQWLRKWSADPRRTRSHLASLVARRCAVSLVMAHDDHGHIRLRRAYGERPKLPAGVELTVIAGADHQFSEDRHRAQFLDLAANFALRPKAATPAAPAPSTRTKSLETVS